MDKQKAKQLKFAKEWSRFLKDLQKYGSDRFRWEPMVLIAQREVEGDEDEEREFFYSTTRAINTGAMAEETGAPKGTVGVDAVCAYLRYAALGLKDEHLDVDDIPTLLLVR